MINIYFRVSFNLVPRVFVPLDQQVGVTRDCGIKRFSSTFYWPEIEHAQLYRKLENDNFVRLMWN